MKELIGLLAEIGEESGHEMFSLIEELFPICRSITGNGVRQTLEKVKKYIELEIHEVPTGTKVFDWTVPKEWNINDAYIKDAAGNRVVDFRKNNLHVVNYSVPVQKKCSLAELKKHLISLPDKPGTIPYRTSYYKQTWGFCVTENQLKSLKDEEYEVCIDSSLDDGSLTYGELVIPGETPQEILLSAHTCHPSLANDNLSGISLLTFLGKALNNVKHKHSYRLIFAPGTIGSITWLARNESIVDRIKYGLVISCVGDSGGPVYKRSRQGSSGIDKAVEHVFQDLEGSIIKDFSPYGYDERQYCSPGFNLAVGLFERSEYGQFPEYHTSDDNLSFVHPENLYKSIRMVTEILELLEYDEKLINTNPKCEPQLGKRGLYEAIGGENDQANLQMAMLWVLNQSDGQNSLLDIAKRAKMPFRTIRTAAALLKEHDLLKAGD